MEKYGRELHTLRLPCPGPVKVTLYCLYEKPKTSWWEGRDKDEDPDVDNLAKTVLDALRGMVWDDDNRAVGLHVEKFFFRHQGVYLIADFYETTRNPKKTGSKGKRTRN